MKKSIFVTGIAGSGKTTASETLNELGYEAYDIEKGICGLFEMYRKDTGERFEDYDNTDVEKMANAAWRCDIEKLKSFLSTQINEIAFYCGTGSSLLEIMSIFDSTLLLKTDSEILNSRLMNREGTNDYGNTKEGRDHILNWNIAADVKIEEQGAIIVNANGSPSEVAENIICAAKNT